VLVILNNGIGTSLKNWKLEGSPFGDFIFPDIFLFSGGSIRIHTAAGENTAIDFYLNQSESAWPPGTTIILSNADNLEITRFTVPEYQFTPTGFYADKNEDLVYFNGAIRDEAGNPVNGFSVLLDNGTFGVLSHPSGPSNHYPDKEDGEWDVAIPNVEDGIGQWTLTVVSYDCPDFAVVFDTQCKQYTRLSADILVEVTYPEETIINANWVCHWDCDKGVLP
jgi:hypothetical protein